MSLYTRNDSSQMTTKSSFQFWMNFCHHFCFFTQFFWRSKILQSYWVIVHRVKQNERCQSRWIYFFYWQLVYVHKNIEFCSYYTYISTYLCKCYVLGNQKWNDLVKWKRKEKEMITIRKRYIFRPWTWIFSQSISQNLVWMVSLNKGHWCRGNSMGIRVPKSKIMFDK